MFFTYWVVWFFGNIGYKRNYKTSTKSKMEVEQQVREKRKEPLLKEVHHRVLKTIYKAFQVYGV